MKERLPQLIIMLSGTLLIIVGVAAVCFQSYIEITSRTFDQFGAGLSNTLVAQPNQFHITTRFPGLELVVVGALLEIVGYLGTRPWNERKNSR